MSLFIQNRVAGRLGRYTFSTEYSPISLITGSGSGDTILDPPFSKATIKKITTIKFGEGKIGWPSSPILPSFFEVTFHDPSGIVRDYFIDPSFEELDWPTTITGPGFLWSGYPKRGLIGRPIGPRTQFQETSVYFYDRLAFLKDLDGSPTTGNRLDNLFNTLFYQLDPRKLLISSTDVVTPGGVDDYAWRTRRFDEELAGNGNGDYGTGWDQIERILSGFGMLLFHNVRTGNFEMINRTIMATEEDFPNATYIESFPPFGAGEIYLTKTNRLAHVESLDRREIRATKNDQLVERGGLAAVILENAGAINWVVDPYFLSLKDDPTPPDYWVSWAGFDNITPSGGENGGVLSQTGGGFVRQGIGFFNNDVDVRAQLSVIANGVVRTRVRLVTGSGTEYWLDSSGEWQTSFQEKVHNTGAAVRVYHEATEDFPDAGDVTVEIAANSFNNFWTGALFYLVDAASALIDDWTFRVGDRGETVTLPSMPTLKVYIDFSNTQDAEVYSYVSGQLVGSLNEFMVQDRLRQDVPGIDNLKGLLFRVVGPETVVRIPKDTGVVKGFIVNGIEIDLKKGTTQGVWLEAKDFTVIPIQASGS